MIGKQIPVAGGLDVTFLEPLGVVGVIVPWNFPMTIAALGIRPGARGGQRGRAEARRVDAADRASGSASSRSRPGCPTGLFQVLPGTGSVVGERFVTHETVRKIVFTGSTAVGKQVMAGCAEQVKSGDPRARRQERQHRVRRLRPREGGGHRAVRACSRTPARTAARAAASSSSAASTTGSWSCSSPPCRASWSATRTTRPPRWARSSRRRTSTR